MKVENYSAVLYVGSWASHKDVRSLLQNEATLVGALLIGNIPAAWFEIENDFDKYGYTKFPIDLYYMDLDGDWIDSDNNGI